jgi:hypothetical protein
VNVVNVIVPYKNLGMWVFDDARVGLVQEPFIAGADTMLDRITAGIPDAERGFALIFSAVPFPGHQFRLDWRRTGAEGDYYYSADLDLEAWLCPALLLYFADPPKALYVRATARRAR